MKKTDDIIDSLVNDLKPMPRRALERRFVIGIVPMVALSLFLMLAVAGLRVDIDRAMTLPPFWIKSAYNAVIALVAFATLYRLARPDGSEGRFFRVLVGIFLTMCVVAVVQLLIAPPETYRNMIFGKSAFRCLLLILGFSLPIFVGTIWALRRAAPVDLRLTGFVAGIAAGAAGAWVYSWFCRENGMPFVLIWYSTGILLNGAIGALLGSRLLRW